MKNAVLVSAVRTPVGKKGGVFRTVQRMDLLKPCILEAIRRAGLEGRETEVDDVILGNNPEARTPARYGWLASGLPVEVPGLTINRACGTSLTGLTLAGTFIKGGYGEVYICGGMTRLPWLIGEANAKRMFYTAARLSGAEAKEYGLVQEVCKPEELIDKTLELAHLIATKAPTPLLLVRKSSTTSARSSLRPVCKGKWKEASMLPTARIAKRPCVPSRKSVSLYSKISNY